MSGGRHRISYGLASLGLWMLASSPVSADAIVLPAHRLTRTDAVVALYRLDKPHTGGGTLTFEWTDGLGRLVERRALPFALAGNTEIRFSLDLSRAVATTNYVQAHVAFDGNGGAAEPAYDTHLTFTVAPAGDPWRDYQIVMWQQKTAQQYAALKTLGVTAGVALGQQDSADTIAALNASDLSWYVENIATDFYSAYHRWTPDHPVNWRFQQIKQRYRDDPADASVFARDPGLSDPRWLRAIRDRLAKTVHAHAGARPLYYSLADEAGIAELSVPWDFDLSEPSLTAMRRWLKARYGTLSALNAQWGTHFRDWDRVVPMTTREAIARGNDNFSAWADFKAWMDVAFARALRVGTDAVHAEDATALAAIEGGQIPGWGGYDYSRLAHAVDLMEVYDGGGNLEILRSLNPKMVLLTTSAGGASERHDIWREMLRGTRGVVLWDADDRFVEPDGAAGPRAVALAGDLRDIRDGIGALLINSERRFDPIAILYSPASLRTQWLLDWKSKGDAWASRDIADSYEDPSIVRAAMMGYAQSLEHIGFQPRFLSPDLLEHGALRNGGYRVLVLPHAIALSARELAAIRSFVEKGGLVVADTEPGAFDEHSKKRITLPVADLVARASEAPGGGAAAGKPAGIHLVGNAELCASDQTPAPCATLRQQLAQLLARSGLTPAVALASPEGARPADISTFVFTNGGTTIIALQRDADDPTAPGGHVRVTLPRPSFVYDLRARKDLGQIAALDVPLDAIEPTLLSITPIQPLPLRLDGPGRAALGRTIAFRIGTADNSPRSAAVYHAAVTGPDGKAIPHYGGNLIAAKGEASLRIPIAVNDPVGRWKIELRDVADGRTAETTLEVYADR
jgi:hypothetical protein